MKNRNSRVFLSDMLEVVNKILTYTKGFSYEDFDRDSKTFDAVIRNFAVMGEAANKINDGIKERYEKIPWKEMTGIRNIIIHEYFGIDKDIIWKTVQDILPELKVELESLYKEEFS